MPVFGPQTASAFSGASNAEDIMLAQQSAALRNQKEKQQQDDQKKQQMARALIGQMLLQAGVKAPQQAGMPQGAGGGQPQGGAPQPGGQAPQQGRAQGGGMPQGQPGAAMAPTEFSWGNILNGLRQQTGADPEVISDAVTALMPEVDKEASRKASSENAEANRQQKNYALLQTLQWEYTNTASQTKRVQIKADVDKIVAQMRGETQRDVANIGAGSREAVANTNAGSRENVANTQAGARIESANIGARTKKEISDDSLALKKELGNELLNIKADEVSKTFLYRERMLDLREKGLDQQAAATQAKLDVTMALAAARDETTRRGQDMVSKDKEAAIAAANTRQKAGLDFKIASTRGKAAMGVDAVISQSDQLIKDAQGLLADPNLDKSVGYIESYAPGVVAGQDVQNFRDKLDSFRSQKMMTLIQSMKAAGNGSTGLGRITNFEAQAIQNSIASLKDTQDPRQFREALTKLIDVVSTSKTHIIQGYEKEFNPPKAKGTGGEGVRVVTPENLSGAEKSQAVPRAFADKPDGTTLENAEGTWTKKGDQILLTSPKKQ